MQITTAPSRSQGSNNNHVLGRGNFRGNLRNRFTRQGKDKAHSEIAHQVLQISPKSSPRILPQEARAPWVSSTHGMESLPPIPSLSRNSPTQASVHINRLDASEWPALDNKELATPSSVGVTVHTCALESPPITPRSPSSDAKPASPSHISVEIQDDEETSDMSLTPILSPEKSPEASVESAEIDENPIEQETEEVLTEIEGQPLSLFLTETVQTESALKSPCSISAETVNVIAVEALSTAPEEIVAAVSPRSSSRVLTESVQAVAEDVLSSSKTLSNPSELSNPLKEAVHMSTQEVRLADPVGTSMARSTSLTTVSTTMGTVSSSSVDSTTLATQASAREIFERAETNMPRQDLLSALRRMQLATIFEAIQASGDQITAFDKLNDIFHTQNKSSLKQLKRIGAFRSDLEKQVAGIQKDSNYKSNKTDTDNYVATSKSYEPISDVSVKLCRELETTIATLAKNITDFSIPANTTSGGLIAMERDLGVSKKSFAGVLNKAGVRTKCIETQWALVSSEWEKQKNALTTSLEQLNQHDVSIRGSLTTYKELVYPETKPFIKATWTTLWAEKGNTTPYRTPALPSAGESTTNDSSDSAAVVAKAS